MDLKIFYKADKNTQDTNIIILLITIIILCLMFINEVIFKHDYISAIMVFVGLIAILWIMIIICGDNQDWIIIKKYKGYEVLRK